MSWLMCPMFRAFLELESNLDVVEKLNVNRFISDYAKEEGRKHGYEHRKERHEGIWIKEKALLTIQNESKIYKPSKRKKRKTQFNTTTVIEKTNKNEQIKEWHV